jgi:uncharacterized protein YjiS (DUF1127 family)
MTAHYPILPLAGSAVLRGVTALLAFMTYWSRQIARARRHRRDAAVLAGLDRSMPTDLGLTRSNVRDAFSEPFWEDPTALLRERALERRWNQALMRSDVESRGDTVFHRPRTDRPAPRDGRLPSSRVAILGVVVQAPADALPLAQEHARAPRWRQVITATCSVAIFVSLLAAAILSGTVARSMKLTFFAVPTAEADQLSIKSSSMNISQMHQNSGNLPVQNFHDLSLVFPGGD